MCQNLELIGIYQESGVGVQGPGVRGRESGGQGRREIVAGSGNGILGTLGHLDASRCGQGKNSPDYSPIWESLSLLPHRSMRAAKWPCVISRGIAVRRLGTRWAGTDRVRRQNTNATRARGKPTRLSSGRLFSSRIAQGHLVGLEPLSTSEPTGYTTARQGRLRSSLAWRTSKAMLQSSTTWKSYMPTQRKSAPFSKA